MKLRQLEKKDAALMLEWMHDDNVALWLGKDFKSMQIQDCVRFIETSQHDDVNRHFAIADDNDEYMGTISLKNIDFIFKRAEYAISCRSMAIGRGFARKATKELFRIARDELDLTMLYLDVYDFNVRARKMYEKAGFVQTDKPDFINGEYDGNLLWYKIDLIN